MSLNTTHTFASGHSGGSTPLADSVTVNGNAGVDVNISLGANTTNQLQAMGYLTANIKGVYIKSDAALTIKVDSSGSPEETINIAAGVPYTWMTGRPDSCLLSSDCNVGWYLSCVAAANVQIRILN